MMTMSWQAARLAERFRQPEVIKKPEGNRVLLLAPHPDDEVIGAGGTLIKHRKAGDPVKVVFMTDGRRGKLRRQTIEEIVRIRREEAVRGCSVLGVEDLVFLNAPDGELDATAETVERLRAVLCEYRPDVLYLPHLRDMHRDHLFTNVVLAAAADSLADDAMVYAYEVWTPLLRPNCVVNITKEFGQKQEAMRCHQSQLELVDYQGRVEGLGRYRSGTIPLPGVMYAEAFYRQPAAVYVQELRAYLNGEDPGEEVSEP
jgi:LmbE family N-acetylglucosaminyl deacetylase